MSDKLQVKVEADGLERIFDRIGSDVRDEVLIKSMKAAGSVIQKATRQNLLNKHGSAATRVNTPWKRSLVKGVTNKADQVYGEVRVSVMGDARSRWLEAGTKKRYLLRTGAKDRSRGRVKGDKRFLYRKKGKENFYQRGTYRGYIKPENNLGEAFDSSMQNAQAAMEKEFIKQMDKIMK